MFKSYNSKTRLNTNTVGVAAVAVLPLQNQRTKGKRRTALSPHLREWARHFALAPVATLRLLPALISSCTWTNILERSLSPCETIPPGFAWRTRGIHHWRRQTRHNSLISWREGLCKSRKSQSLPRTSLRRDLSGIVPPGRRHSTHGKSVHSISNTHASVCWMTARQIQANRTESAG